MIADRAFTLVTSKAIMAELYRVLHYPQIQKLFKPSEDDINEFIGMIIEHALITKVATASIRSLTIPRTICS